ncbi:uncharacterized protein LOC125655765 isoform X2 [Ostrea edulis]|uniref:uncharacterized protein LOC125655765 isoform X2 n=1 Tax=Ostrea edulis TaxID=37623 RepID=UPI0024AF248F|nr:uncharacterized protein LOC125655765 isoform X2 [Ostrea edulis]
MLVALISPCNARSKTMPNKHFTTRNIFLIVICTSLSRVRSIPADYTWYGAQKTCQEKNDSLTIQKTESDEYYWMGYHKKISSWIKLIGCYSDQDIPNKNTKHFNMFNSSAGLCQEYCTSDGYAYFAVKSRRCHCLMVLPTTHSTKPLCSFGCDNKFDDKLSTECGGDTAFNVFATSEEEFHDQLQYNCLNLECGNSSKILKTENCSDALHAICGENLAIRDNYSGWRSQLENCKSRNNAYLYGNVDIRGAPAACRNIAMSFESPNWIGVLREQYQSEDRSKSGPGNISKNRALLCQKCNRDGCIFTNCYEKLHNTVFCKTLTVTISPQGLAENDESLGSIIAPIITITIVGIIGGVLLFIYIRRKRHHTNNETRDKYPNTSNNAGNKVCKNVETKRTENKNAEYTESHDLSERDGYFDLASSYPNHGVADENNGECSSPYNDAEEGDYDHLRETKSRQKETDDTYHHALHVHVGDSSDYDVTRRKYDQETENMYDKTGGNNLDSEYGYNKMLPNNEESPYDKTFTASQI